MSGAELLHRFVHGDFEQLAGTEPAELANYLERRAAETGQSASLFVSQAIRAVYTLFREHEESGGVRLEFSGMVDAVVRERMPVIQRSEPHWAAKLARDFRDEIQAVERYDPRGTDD